MSQDSPTPRTKAKRGRKPGGHNRPKAYSPISFPEAGFSKEELFALWKLFRHQEDALQMMMDFSLLPKHQAAQLIREFWEREGHQEPPTLPPIEPEDATAPSSMPRAKHDQTDFEW